MWKCPRCETMNDGDYCYNCGQKAPVPSAEGGNTREYPEQAVPSEEFYPNYYEESSRSNTGLIITIIVCVTVIIAMVLGIGTYIFVTGKEEKAPAESVSVTTTAPPAPSAPAETSVPEPTAAPEPKETLAADADDTEEKADTSPKKDVTIKRDEFLSRASAIEEYAENNLDTALSQADLNRESSIVYSKWDELLNDVYQYLKTTLSADDFSDLKDDEVNWIKEKEAAIEAAGAQWKGGTGEPFARNSAGIEYTSKRCYYLITFIK